MPRLTQSLPPQAELRPDAESSPLLDAATQAEIDQLIADLESLGPVDVAAKQALSAELAGTQPVVRRALIQQHRALIAYRKQQAARAAEPAEQPAETTPGVTAVFREGRAPDAASIPHGSQSQAAQEGVPLDELVAAAVEPAASAAGLQFPASARGAVSPRTDDRVPSADDGTAGAAASEDFESQPDQDESAAEESVEAATVKQPDVRADEYGEGPSTMLTLAEHSLPDRIDEAQIAPAGHVAFEPMGDDWQPQLEAAIAALEDDLAADPAAANDDRPIRLRILYLLAGRREDALRLPADMPADEQEFWSRELFGLSAWLDDEEIADPRRRATEAARHLHDAAASLGALGNLQVRNVAFCTEVKGFGVCTPFDRNEFKPREQVILYWEVENLKIDSTPKGHRTALKARYQIFDAQGANVDQGDFPVTEEYCQNRRRDYFVRYYLWLPDRLYDGRYTLKLTVEDALNGNVGQGSLEFVVRAR